MTTPPDRWIRFGILAILLLAPTQWAVEVRPKTFVSPVDPVLAVTAGLGLLWAWRGRLATRLALPAPFALLFVLVGLLSVTAAQNRMAAAKDAVQWGLYFVGAWTLFRYGLDDIKTRRAAFALVLCVTVAILLLTVVQFFRPSVADLDVRSTFGNRNVLAGFLALALPFAFAQALAGGNPLVGLAGVILTLVGLGVTLSGAAVLGIALALLAMAATQSRFAVLLTLCFLCFLFAVLHPNLPRRGDDKDPWLDSIALHNAEGELSRRYPDWECAWLMMAEHPWRGIGAGNYQERISSYRRIPTQPGKPEPDTQNLFLVLGTTLGFPGLLAFLAMLLEGMAAALRTVLVPTGRSTPEDRTLALGAFGALMAFSVTAIWHPLLVRGIGIPLVAVLALAHHLDARSTRS